MSQKQLFDTRGKETHGAIEFTGRTGRAWCGKNVARDRVTVNGARPTCYQCGLIFDRERASSTPAAEPANFRPWEIWYNGRAIRSGLTEAEARSLANIEQQATAARQATGPMSILECAALLVSRNCFGCGGEKAPKMAFCLNCWRRLAAGERRARDYPNDLQRRLYRRFGDGFAEAYAEAMAMLGRPVDYGK